MLHNQGKRQFLITVDGYTKKTFARRNGEKSRSVSRIRVAALVNMKGSNLTQLHESNFS